MEDLKSILLKTTSLLPKDFYLVNKRLWEEDNIVLLSQRLLLFYHKQLPFNLPLPYFKDEITPSLKDCFSYFEAPLHVFHQEESEEKKLALFANAIQTAGVENILVLMGQRITPGSIRDTRAIPPLRSTLIQSASTIYSGKLTCAAREWSKHTNRSQDNFWGEIKGDDEIKNQLSIDFVLHVLKDSTWWNVFWHYKHEMVYESRVPSGHGARWGMDGNIFIGFLEPFLS
jgi:hypothetical protein